MLAVSRPRCALGIHARGPAGSPTGTVEASSVSWAECGAAGAKTALGRSPRAGSLQDGPGSVVLLGGSLLVLMLLTHASSPNPPRNFSRHPSPHRSGDEDRAYTA